MSESGLVIDRASRDRLALLVRRLASAGLTTYEFLAEAWRLTDSPDPAILSIVDAADVFFCDLHGPRLTGRKALNRAERRSVARIVVFLRSSIPYAWPPNPDGVLLGLFLWLFTFGRLGSRRGGWGEWEQAGEVDAWPFLRIADCRRATGCNPFASAVGARAV